MFALACLWLRNHAYPVAEERLFGVVVEIPDKRGHDVLASYSDGSVRFIHSTGGVAVFDGIPALVPAARALHLVSKAIVAVTGPWLKPRLPPPAVGRTRFTFLVSDGLHFGEGPAKVTARDPMGGPVLARATDLLDVMSRITPTGREASGGAQ